MSKVRSGRINEEVMRVIAELLPTVKDPRLSEGLLSVSHCTVTKDLKFATIYVSVLGLTEEGEKRVSEGLKSAASYLRRELARRLQLRITPELHFRLDDSITYGSHINEMIAKEKEKGTMGDET